MRWIGWRDGGVQSTKHNADNRDKWGVYELPGGDEGFTEEEMNISEAAKKAAKHKNLDLREGDCLGCVCKSYCVDDGFCYPAAYKIQAACEEYAERFKTLAGVYGHGRADLVNKMCDLKNECERLEKGIRSMMSACGNPNTGDACRAVLAFGKETLAEMEDA